MAGAERKAYCRELFRNFDIYLSKCKKGVYYTGIKLVTYHQILDV
jgi:hypothetical protein